MERTARIIFDTPAAEDAFDSGGHKRSAIALAESIRQLKGRNGSIGLEGQWGAGKSTVINLAEKELKDNPSERTSYCVFPFDLWEHQSDDFRRAFLEEFVNWLHVKEHLSFTEAEDAKDKIRDRIKTVRSQNHKEYNLFGSIILLLAPLTPILYSWLTPAALTAQSVQNPIKETFSIELSQAVMITLSFVYFLFLARVVYFCFRSIKDDSGNAIKVGHWKKLNIAVSKALSMFSKDVEKEATKQSIRESDPTTIEFHGIFRDLLSKVQGDDKRLIFILDNIDRLPEDCISLVWSEVRSLFSNSSFKDKDRNSFVTAVVPYDKNFIEKAFKAKAGQGADDKEAGSDVFSKTFSVILRVAPPVATDWAKFLRSRLNEAFNPNFNDETTTRLFSVLKYSFQKQNIHPTPRRIITFVNEMASLWLQWGEIISAESIALYILHRHQIEHNPTALLTNMMDDRFIQITGVSDWQKDFAALSLNVSPDDSYQILLKQPVISALSSNLSDKLIELEKSNGFREVFLDALAEAIGNVGTKNPASLANIAKNIQSIKLETAINSAVLRSMAKALAAIDELDLSNADVFDGLIKIVSGQDQGNLMHVANAFRDKIFSFANTGSEKAHVDGQNWLKSISRIGESINQSLGSNAKSEFFSKTKIPDGAEFVLGVAYACSQKGLPDFKDLVCETPAADIFSSLNNSSKIASSKDANIFNLTLIQLSKFLDDGRRNSLINLVSDGLRTNDETNDTRPDDLLDALSRLYSEIKERKSAKGVINSLVTDGTLIWHAHNANEYDSFEALADAQFLIAEISGANQSPTSQENHSTFGNLGAMKNWYSEVMRKPVAETDQLDKLAKLVSRNGRFYQWLLYGQESEFFKSVCLKAVEKKELGALNTEECVFNYDQIKSILGEDAALKFLETFSGWKKHFSDKFLGDSVLKLSSSFIEDIYKLADPKPYEIILNKVDDYLKALSQEDWLDTFDKEDDRLRLLIVRRKTSDISFVDPFKPALLVHASGVLEGEKIPEKYTSDWGQVFFALKPANQKKLAEDFLNSLQKLNTTTEGCENFVWIYGELAKTAPYSIAPDTSLDKIFSKLINSDEEDIKEFARSKIADIKKCLKNSSELSSKSFEETVSSLEESGSEQKISWAEELRKSLALKPKEPPANDDDGNDEKPKAG